MFLLPNFFSIFKKNTSKDKASFYGGAKKTLANRDFWNANSDFETTAQPDRATLTARARWTVANFSVAKNAVRAISVGTIGDGITLQSKTGDNDVDNEIEAWWKNIQESLDITGELNFTSEIQALVLEASVTDGEIFIRLMDTKEGLKIQLLEMEALDESKGTNGIEFDAFYKPLRYYFKTPDFKSVAIEAKDIIHIYKKERASQRRGISELAPAVKPIKDFSAFQNNIVESARVQSTVAYSVTTERDGVSFGKRASSDYQSGDIVEVNGANVFYLRDGEGIQTLDQKAGGSDYASFINSTVRSIAISLGLSFEIVWRDYSQVTYLSSRVSSDHDKKLFSRKQKTMINKLMKVVFNRAFDLAVMLGTFNTFSRKQYLSDPKKYNNVKYIVPRSDFVDPLKDLKSVEIELRIGSITRTDFCASRNQDYEENLRVQKKELEKKKEILGDFYEEVVAMEAKNLILQAALLNKEDDSD